MARVTSDEPGWRTLASREVYANRWIRVHEDDVTRPDGGTGIYGVVEVRQPAVFVVAVTDADEVLLVTLERYTTGRSVEVPAGGSDGEDLEAAARRELLEETGHTAREWTALGTQFALNGVARAEARVFLARGLSREAGAEVDAAEGISGVSAHPWGEVRAMLRDGTIHDSETAGALLLAAIELGWA